VRLVDFGFAKRVYTRTFTVCGTPEYLAPELLTMRGHGLGVDWWALGVLLYEMVVGVAPFCFDAETGRPDAELPPPELYRNILNPKYELPFPSRLSEPICRLIERLLTWDPLTRLGCLTDGARDVQRQTYYSHIDWARLEAKQIAPPYVPPLDRPDDTRHFEEQDQAEIACFLDEEPYEHKGAWDARF
jgi:protein kinase X